MTLTRLLPTLRRSIPDPIEPRRWPAGTRVSTNDVIVGGFSMVRLAERDGTPLVQLDPTPSGRPGEPPRHLGVVVTTVQSIALIDGERRIVLDAEHGPHRPDWPEARLIGRVSVARHAPAAARFATGGCHALAQLELPGDLVAGDLVAVPVVATLVRTSAAIGAPGAAALRSSC